MTTRRSELHTRRACMVDHLTCIESTIDGHGQFRTYWATEYDENNTTRHNNTSARLGGKHGCSKIGCLAFCCASLRISSTCCSNTKKSVAASSLSRVVLTLRGGGQGTLLPPTELHLASTFDTFGRSFCSIDHRSLAWFII